MFIKKIHIENFKCIRNGDFELNEGLNIFVGDNGVGKTTVLEALDLALLTISLKISMIRIKSMIV